MDLQSHGSWEILERLMRWGHAREGKDLGSNDNDYDNADGISFGQERRAGELY
jgi:hypothetical protein